MPSDRSAFEFDYAKNLFLRGGHRVRLSPHEADILRVLLSNQARPIDSGTLIRHVYGAREPDAAFASVRVAIYSLRKKLALTGVAIRNLPGVGYEIDLRGTPAPDDRLPDKILTALHHARTAGEPAVERYLQLALDHCNN